ncbi:hypothetical protein LshimejAT787_2100060 [Lyophyllum shimeji]|uniref:Uncharacterized protein n=1 Tax=Lyophyllum shimeji TaxID=47721 RepID=A0A9P3Q0V8_LYOSH|nr:hypothetical protein LshimejAT787_2100060 [Lyophyllum shimeji]
MAEESESSGGSAKEEEVDGEEIDRHEEEDHADDYQETGSADGLEYVGNGDDMDVEHDEQEENDEDRQAEDGDDGGDGLEWEEEVERQGIVSGEADGHEEGNQTMKLRRPRHCFAGRPKRRPFYIRRGENEAGNVTVNQWRPRRWLRFASIPTRRRPVYVHGGVSLPSEWSSVPYRGYHYSAFDILLSYFQCSPRQGEIHPLRFVQPG